MRRLRVDPLTQILRDLNDLDAHDDLRRVFRQMAREGARDYRVSWSDEADKIAALKRAGFHHRATAHQGQILFFW